MVSFWTSLRFPLYGNILYFMLVFLGRISYPHVIIYILFHYNSCFLFKKKLHLVQHFGRFHIT